MHDPVVIFILKVLGALALVAIVWVWIAPIPESRKRKEERESQERKALWVDQLDEEVKQMEQQKTDDSLHD